LLAGYGDCTALLKLKHIHLPLKVSQFTRLTMLLLNHKNFSLPIGEIL
jgi:hypothetical protein